ncbi:YkyA family protein, partial [Staphylococcus epidermidis]
DNSEKEFKQAKQYLEHVENKAKKKEVEQLDSAIKEKYKSHDAYAKAYKKALNKEKELFSYLNEDNATQSEVDGKSKDLSKAYKEMNNKFNAYSKAIEKVKREKQDVDQLK